LRIAALFLILSVIPVFAAQKQATYETCLDRAGGVTVSMRDCSAAESERLHKALDASYQKKLAATPLAQKAALAKAQKSWEDFHKIDCDRLYTQDGTLWLTVGDSCSVSQEQERVSELNRSEIELSKSWPPVSPGFRACLEKQDIGCINAEFARQDKVLNDTYRKTLATMTQADKDDEPGLAKRKPVLVKTERAWISWRNAQCDYLGLSQGPAASAVCQMEMTRRRAADLEYYRKIVAVE